MADKIIIDYSISGVPNSGALNAVASGSTSATVPANTELLGITVTNPTCFRVGVGSQTATATDPMASPGFQPIYIKLNPQLSYTIAAVLATNQPTSGPTAGTLSFFRVFEG